jgi:hypothetical protein
MNPTQSLNPTGAEPAALPHYEQALHRLRCLIDDPVASVDAALAVAPDFVMAHALRAYLHLLGTEPPGIAIARDSLAAARAIGGTAAERAHLMAIGHLVDGSWHAAGRVLEDVAIADPLDALALQVGHQIDFFTGHSRMLRDRIARALPAWDATMPAYHALLGMHAFGLEETGEYARAEVAGKRCVELQPRDTWGQHAVAHVMEMQGRLDDGIAWMNDRRDDWAADSFLAVHNWWHLALYHLERGETEQVLALYDGPILGGRTAVVLEMLDASAMLWRLFLRGVDVGDRWHAIADLWAPLATAGNYAFNDAHAMMAFVGAGRDGMADNVLAAQREAMGRDDDNAAFTREVGHPVTRAIKAFGDGDYATTVTLLRPVRSIAHRFGGSHAQRDLVDLTLIEAAFRAGDTGLARALSAERLAWKPHSPLSGLFARRAGWHVG